MIWSDLLKTFLSWVGGAIKTIAPLFAAYKVGQGQKEKENLEDSLDYLEGVKGDEDASTYTGDRDGLIKWLQAFRSKTKP